MPARFALLFLLTIFAFHASAESEGLHRHESESNVESMRSPQERKTGAELNRALAKPLTVTQSNQTLRNFLNKLANDQGVSIFLDRRVDPEANIQLRVENKTVLQILYLVAEQVKTVPHDKPLAVIRIEDVIYLGPQKPAAQFYFEYHENRKQVNKISNRVVRQKWLRKEALKWERLSRPRGLAMEIVKSNKLDLHSAIDLPNDLWDEGWLCRSSVLCRISLLAVGFGKTIVVAEDGQSFEVAKAYPKKTYTHAYSLRSNPGVRKIVEAESPNADKKVEGSKLVVTTDPVRHYRIRRQLVLAKKSSSVVNNPKAIKRVDLDTEARIGDVLNSVAARLNVKLEFDPSLNEVLQKRVKISVKQASYESIIRKSLEGTELNFELSTEKLRVFK